MKLFDFISVESFLLIIWIFKFSISSSSKTELSKRVVLIFSKVVLLDVIWILLLLKIDLENSVFEDKTSNFMEGWFIEKEELSNSIFGVGKSKRDWAVSYTHLRAHET